MSVRSFPRLLVAASLALSAPRALAQQPPALAPRPASSYIWLPTVHAALGARIPLNAAAGEAGLALDVQVGAMYLSYESPRLFVMPALGYAYDGSETRGGHFGTAGVAVMFGSVWVGAGVSSRAVLGDSHGAFAAGLRNGVIGQVLGGGITLEVAHQWLSVRDEDRHDLRIVVAVNPISLVLALALRSIRGLD